MCGGCQRQRLAHVLRLVLQRLAGQRVHDVEVEGVERLRRFFHRRNRLGAVMHAAQRLQMRVVKTLHADGQAGHAGAAKGLEAVFFKRAGVGFQRDLAVGLQPSRARMSPSRRSMACGENRLGVPPPMKMLCTVRPQISGSDGLQVGHQRIDVALLGHLAGRFVRVEIAVRAFFQAPGQVHIERQRRQGGQLQRAAAHVVLDVFVGSWQGSTSGLQPAFAHQLHHLARRLAAVAVGVFHLDRQLRKGLAKLGNEHHRVEAKAVAAHGLAAQFRRPRGRTAISGSGSSAERTATSVLTSAARRWSAASGAPSAPAGP